MRCPDELKTDKPLLWSTGTGRDVWAMLCAAREGDVAAVRRLLKKDPSLARCSYAYRTPLYFAVLENRVSVVSLLLETAWPEPASLHVARERGYAEVVQLLEERLDERGEPVAAAIRAKDLRKVRKLLEGAPELVHARDLRGNQAIHWAVMTRQLKMIDAVLERGADINGQRTDGALPVQLTNGDYYFRGWRDASSEKKPKAVLEHLRKKGAAVDICTASFFGDIERVRELLSADPGLANRPSDYVTYYACSGTPLRNAAQGGHIEIVRLLLAAGTDPNLREEGIAPLGHALHAAVCSGHREIVELLLAHGARPNVPVESSADTLSAAIRNGDGAMVELLASRGAFRSLEMLAYYGDVQTAAAMLGANPKLANDPGALVYAAEEGQTAFVRLLLRVRPGLSKKVGVGGKSREITEMLLADGMDLNHRDWLGATPLHQFARRGDVENARLFLERGARVDIVDDEWRLTAHGWAMKHGHPEIAELISAKP